MSTSWPDQLVILRTSELAWRALVEARGTGTRHAAHSAVPLRGRGTRARDAARTPRTIYLNFTMQRCDDAPLRRGASGCSALRLGQRRRGTERGKLNCRSCTTPELLRYKFGERLGRWNQEWICLLYRFYTFLN